MTKPITEALVEDITLGYFTELGYDTLYGPDIAPTTTAAEWRPKEVSHGG